MKGFSLVEGLIAVLMTFFIAVGIAGLLTYFGIYARRNVDLTCLINAASSAIEACRGGTTQTQFICGGRTITVGISCPTNLGNNQCQTVTTTASDGNRSFSLSDVVCNLQ